MSKNNLLFTSAEWTEHDINNIWAVVSKIAKEKYNLSFYEPQFTIVDFETMLVNQSFTYGLPVSYAHWSHGKNYFAERDSYIHGSSGLSYEMIINSDPAVTYLMADNSTTMQTLVLAHAAVGHASFFKNNHAFKEGMNPKTILALTQYAKNYIAMCEKKYGETTVEEVLDFAHALAPNSIDRSTRRCNDNLYKRVLEYNSQLESNYDEIFKKFDKKLKLSAEGEDMDIEQIFPETNLLYYIEKNSKVLVTWEREVLSIVRALHQYFYPQALTKMMNEGYASFWHHTLMYDLYDQGYISEGSMMEALDSHCGVIHQFEMRPAYHLNPYKLGSEIFFDIKRMCENPTDEDKEWFPYLVGKDWQQEIQLAMENFTDSSFILQYLSPHIVRKLGLSNSSKCEEDEYQIIYEVTEIQADCDFRDLRRNLSEMYSYEEHHPTIAISAETDDELILSSPNAYALHSTSSAEVCRYIKILMGKAFVNWKMK